MLVKQSCKKETRLNKKLETMNSSKRHPNSLHTIPKAAFAEKAALKSDLIHLERVGERRKTVPVNFAAFA